MFKMRYAVISVSPAMRYSSVRLARFKDLGAAKSFLAAHLEDTSLVIAALHNDHNHWDELYKINENGKLCRCKILYKINENGKLCGYEWCPVTLSY